MNYPTKCDFCGYEGSMDEIWRAKCGHDLCGLCYDAGEPCCEDEPLPEPPDDIDAYKATLDYMGLDDPYMDELERKETLP